ncbi:MAG: TRAP transporter large permease subunit [Deltaproteobacteria bacterium]|nr:TRAP transporter large permease subunit [Deltaproteobacteria bacterium]
MPIAYATVAIRIIWIRFDRWRERGLLFALAALVLAGIAVAGEGVAAWLRWPGIVLVIAATVLGAPIYVALGGAALVLFWADGTPIASVAAETVRQVASPTMPTIPLFTFAGYLLAESQTSTRLVRVMRALVGWLPGGAAIITAAVCAFFTTFTGASGVTILALGGLLLPILLKGRYPEGFSIGLLTASGSIGLLFPPSLPVIFYGVIAGVPVDQLYVAGLLPGLVLVAAVAAFGARVGVKHGAERVPFALREAGAALWEAKWELMLPLIVVSSIAFGWTTLVEAAALTAAYALFIEVVIYKDLGIRADLPRVARECSVLIGGVLIILGVAMGFTSYLVDAEIPARGLELVRGEISSRWVFLAVLNLFLLLVGCLMDIYSAVVVVVPLILPIAAHFGVHPIHLGIIFLANLELGFLTPPVGMNLFLSAYRFDKPVMEVARRALPFLLVLILAVLLITYLPSLTLAPVEWLFGPGALAPQEIDL